MEHEEHKVQPTHLWCRKAPRDLAQQVLREYCQDIEPIWAGPAEEYLCMCSKCLDHYQEGKRILLEQQPNMNEILKSRDSLRLRAWIEWYTEQREDDVPASDLAILRGGQLQQPIIEILQHPKLLFDKELNASFVKYVEFEYSRPAQPSYAAPIPVTQMPGILMLLIHPNQMVRKWASRMLPRDPPITRENYNEVDDIITCMLSPVEFGLFDTCDDDTMGSEMLPRDLVCIKDQKAYWKGIVQVLRCLDKDAIKTRLMGGHSTIADALVNVIMESKQSDTSVDSWETSVFWPALECLEVLLSKLEYSLWDHISLKPDKILMDIVSHPVFEIAISGQQQSAFASSLSARSSSINGFSSPQVNANEPFIWLRTFIHSFLDVGDLAHKYINHVILFLVYRAACGLDPENSYFDNDGCTSVDASEKKRQAASMVEKVMTTFLDIMESLLRMKLYEVLIGSAHGWPHTFVLYLQQEHPSPGVDISTSQQQTKHRCVKIMKKLLKKGLQLDQANQDYAEFLQRMDSHRHSISGNRSLSRERQPSGEGYPLEGMGQTDIERFIRAISGIVQDLKEKKDEDEGVMEVAGMPNNSSKRMSRPTVPNGHDEGARRDKASSGKNKNMVASKTKVPQKKSKHQKKKEDDREKLADTDNISNNENYLEMQLANVHQETSGVTESAAALPQTKLSQKKSKHTKKKKYERELLADADGVLDENHLEPPLVDIFQETLDARIESGTHKKATALSKNKHPHKKSKKHQKKKDDKSELSTDATSDNENHLEIPLANMQQETSDARTKSGKHNAVVPKTTQSRKKYRTKKTDEMESSSDSRSELELNRPPQGTSSNDRPPAALGGPNGEANLPKRVSDEMKIGSKGTHSSKDIQADDVQPICVEEYVVKDTQVEEEEEEQEEEFYFKTQVPSASVQQDEEEDFRGDDDMKQKGAQASASETKSVSAEGDIEEVPMETDETDSDDDVDDVMLLSDVEGNLNSPDNNEKMPGAIPSSAFDADSSLNIMDSINTSVTAPDVCDRESPDLFTNTQPFEVNAIDDENEVAGAIPSSDEDVDSGDDMMCTQPFKPHTNLEEIDFEDDVAGTLPFKPTSDLEDDPNLGDYGFKREPETNVTEDILVRTITVPEWAAEILRSSRSKGYEPWVVLTKVTFVEDPCVGDYIDLREWPNFHQYLTQETTQYITQQATDEDENEFEFQPKEEQELNEPEMEDFDDVHLQDIPPSPQMDEFDEDERPPSPRMPFFPEPSSLIPSVDNESPIPPVRRKRTRLFEESDEDSGEDDVMKKRKERRKSMKESDEDLGEDDVMRKRKERRNLIEESDEDSDEDNVMRKRKGRRKSMKEFDEDSGEDDVMRKRKGRRKSMKESDEESGEDDVMRKRKERRNLIKESDEDSDEDDVIRKRKERRKSTKESDEDSDEDDVMKKRKKRGKSLGRLRVKNSNRLGQQELQDIEKELQELQEDMKSSQKVRQGSDGESGAINIESDEDDDEEIDRGSGGQLAKQDREEEDVKTSSSSEQDTSSDSESILSPPYSEPIKTKPVKRDFSYSIRKKKSQSSDSDSDRSDSILTQRQNNSSAIIISSEDDASDTHNQKQDKICKKKLVMSSVDDSSDSQNQKQNETCKKSLMMSSEDDCSDSRSRKQDKMCKKKLVMSSEDDSGDSRSQKRVKICKKKLADLCLKLSKLKDKEGNESGNDKTRDSSSKEDEDKLKKTKKPVKLKDNIENSAGINKTSYTIEENDQASHGSPHGAENEEPQLKTEEDTDVKAFSSRDNLFDPFGGVILDGTRSSPPLYTIDDDDEDIIPQTSCDLIAEDVFSQLDPDTIIISSDDDDEFNVEDNEAARQLDFPFIKPEPEAEETEEAQRTDGDCDSKETVKTEESVDNVAKSEQMSEVEASSVRSAKDNDRRGQETPQIGDILREVVISEKQVEKKVKAETKVKVEDADENRPQQAVSEPSTTKQEPVDPVRDVKTDTNLDADPRQSLYSDITSDDDENNTLVKQEYIKVEGSDEEQPHQAVSGSSATEQGPVDTGSGVKTDVKSDSDPRQSLYSELSEDDEYNALLEQEDEPRTSSPKSEPQEGVDVDGNISNDRTIAETSSTDQTSVVSDRDDEMDVNGDQDADGTNQEPDDTLQQGEADDDNTIIDYNVALGMPSVMEQDDEGQLDISLIGEADDDNAIIDYNEEDKSEKDRPLSATSFYRERTQGEMSRSDQLAGERYLEAVADKVGSSPSSLSKKSFWSPKTKPSTSGQSTAPSDRFQAPRPMPQQQNDKPKARAPVKSCANRFTSRQGALFATMKGKDGSNSLPSNKSAEQGVSGQVNPPDSGQPLGEINRLVESENVSEGGGRPVDRSDALSASTSTASASVEVRLVRGKENEPVPERLEPAVVRPVSFPAAEVKPSRVFHAEHFLKWVLAWNCDWLMQGKDFTYISAILNKCPYRTLKDVPKLFKSMDHYYEVFIPHLLVETWAKLIREYFEAKNPEMECIMYRTPAKEAVQSGHMMTCQVRVPIPRDKESDPKFNMSEEDFVIISPHPDSNPSCGSVFGIVSQVTTTKMSLEAQQSYIGVAREIVPSDEAPRKFKEVTLLTDLNFQAYNGQPFNLQVMGSLVTATRQFRALKSFHKSTLARDILRFRRMDVFCHDNSRRQGLESAIPCTSKEVTDAAVKALSEPDTLPRIFLLQGPPGTGKTYTIINIIVKMLQIKTACANASVKQVSGQPTPHPKILLCAPSNAAVDVVVCRLVEALLKEERQGQGSPDPKKSHHNAGRYSVIRLGRKDQVHADAKQFSLEDVVERTMTRNRLDQSVFDAVDREIRDLDKQIIEVKKNMDKLMLAGKKDELQQLQGVKDAMCNQLKALEKSKPKTHHTQGERTHCDVNRIRQKVLTRADVICCTLNSSGSQMFQSHIYEKNNNRLKQLIHFSCVIVDEATQCTEPDCLIPLQYGSSKLLLVGDPQQLPATVISQDAGRKKYSQSLFERHYRYFKLNQEIIPHNPVRMLKEQFRMHTEICRLPSKQFYEGHVETNRDVSKLRDLFFLYPYLLFDVADGREHCYAAGAVTNVEEANFLKELYHYIQHEAGRRQQGIALSIGIITPYQTQKRLLIKMFQGLDHVEIATVDSFQGREKDVILLSCVRTNGETQGIGFVADPKRMNVALTRARYALYVAGNLRSLYSDRNWRALIQDAHRRQAIRKASKGDYRRVVNYCKKRRRSVGSNNSSGGKAENTSTSHNVTPIQPVEEHDLITPPETAVATSRPRKASGDNLNKTVPGTSNQGATKPSNGQEKTGAVAGDKSQRPQNGSKKESGSATKEKRPSTAKEKSSTFEMERNQSATTRPSKPSGSVIKSSANNKNRKVLSEKQTKGGTSGDVSSRNHAERSSGGKSSKSKSHSEKDRSSGYKDRQSSSSKEKSGKNDKEKRPASNQNVNKTGGNQTKKMPSKELSKTSNPSMELSSNADSVQVHRRLSLDGQNLPKHKPDKPRRASTDFETSRQNKKDGKGRSDVVSSAGHQRQTSTSKKDPKSATPLMTSTPEKWPSRATETGRPKLLISPNARKKLSKGIQRVSSESESDRELGDVSHGSNQRMQSATIQKEFRRPDSECIPRSSDKRQAGSTEGSTISTEEHSRNVFANVVSESGRAKKTARKSFKNPANSPTKVTSDQRDRIPLHVTQEQSNFGDALNSGDGPEDALEPGWLSPSRNRAKRGRAWKPGDGLTRQDSMSRKERAKKNKRNKAKMALLSNRDPNYQNYQKTYSHLNQSDIRQPTFANTVPEQDNDEDDDVPLSQNSHLRQVIQKVKSRNSNQSLVKMVEPEPKRRRRSSGDSRPDQDGNDKGASEQEQAEQGDIPSEALDNVQNSSHPNTGGDARGEPEVTAKRQRKSRKDGESTESGNNRKVPEPEKPPSSVPRQKQSTSVPSGSIIYHQDVPNAKRRIAHKRKIHSSHSSNDEPLQKKNHRQGHPSGQPGINSDGNNEQSTIRPPSGAGEPVNIQVNQPHHAQAVNANQSANQNSNVSGRTRRQQTFNNQARLQTDQHQDRNTERGPRAPMKSCLRKVGQQSRGLGVTFSRDTRDNTEESRNKSMEYQNWGWPPPKPKTPQRKR